MTSASPDTTPHDPAPHDTDPQDPGASAAVAGLAGLAGLLAPLDADEFRTRRLGTQVVAVPAQADKVRGLFGWRDLTALLSAHHLDWYVPEPVGFRVHDQVEVLVDGVAVPPVDFCREVPARRGGTAIRVDQEKLNHLLRQGATILLHRTHERHRALRDLAAALERDLQAPVRCTVVASWGDRRTIRHVDASDGFIVHLAGRKRWQVHQTAPTDASHEQDPGGPGGPERSGAVGAGVPIPGELAWEGELEAGSVLYVPRGWLHEVVPVESPSLHLIFAVERRRSADLLAWFVDQLKAREVFRRDLPRFGAPEQRVERARQLRAHIEELWDDDLVERFMADDDATAVPDQPELSLPFSATRAVLPDGDDVRLRTRGRRTPQIEQGDGRCVVRMLDRQWSMAAADLEVVRPLLEGEPVTVGQLRARAEAAAVPEARLRDTLVDFVLGGIAIIEDAWP